MHSILVEEPLGRCIAGYVAARDSLFDEFPFFIRDVVGQQALFDFPHEANETFLILR